MWYGISVVFESNHVDTPDDNWLCEERILLFSAENLDMALDMAVAYAKKEEHEYVSMAGSRIAWRFKEILESYEMANQPESGTEVLCRYLKNETTKELRKKFED